MISLASTSCVSGMNWKPALTMGMMTFMACVTALEMAAHACWTYGCSCAMTP